MGDRNILKMSGRARPWSAWPSCENTAARKHGRSPPSDFNYFFKNFLPHTNPGGY